MDKNWPGYWKCHCECGCSILCLTTQMVCDTCSKEVTCTECGDSSACHPETFCGDIFCCGGCYGRNCWDGKHECYLTEKEVLENFKSS